MICGGIGGGAINAMAESGIKVFAGASGNADEVIKSYLEGTLAEVGEATCDHHDHEHHGDDRADVEQTQQQEESAQVMEILLGEDRSRIDGFTASDADDGFIKTDGGADVEVGDPDSHHIEDDHQQEREEVLQTIADAVSDGLHDVEFLSCHSDSGISGLKFMQKYK